MNETDPPVHDQRQLINEGDMTAWIEGKAVSLDAAAAEAARLLRSSRMPVITGLATDVAGARAAIALAEKLRGAYDHVASDALLRNLDVMRQAGLMLTTPNELRVRADCVVLVGAKLTALWPDMLTRFDLAAPARFDETQAPRTIIRIGAGRGDAAIADAIEIAAQPAALPQQLANLRALLVGHRVRQAKRGAPKLDDVAERLKAARFGVCVWASESLDTLSIEMIYEIIKDLNKTTRFSGLPIAPSLNGTGVMQTSGWMTGFPIRTGFGRGYPEHDSWRFDAMRMIEAGEADTAVWISAYDHVAPEWRAKVPLIALATAQTKFPYQPHVRIDIGTPGLDHDGIEHVPEAATLALKPAQNRSDALPAAAAISLIDQHIAEGETSC
jgi:formylmethanofuran dehydrogenase subunit B